MNKICLKCLQLICLWLLLMGSVYLFTYLYQSPFLPKYLQDKIVKKSSYELENYNQFDPKLGYLPSERLGQAMQYTQFLKKQALDEGLNTLATIPWEERGPSLVGGRTRSFLFDKRDDTNNTVFAGGVTGGLWKSTDFMSDPPNWQPLGDLWENIGVCALVQNPNNLDEIYAGTGEPFVGGSFLGQGIWKSTDGGLSWSQLSSTTNSSFIRITRLVIDNNNKLYAATEVDGLHQSIDGGISWTKVLGDGMGATSEVVTDIELGADGSLYASVGGPFDSDLNGAYKSDVDDFGTGVGNLGNWTSIPIAQTYIRIELAAAASNANVLYAVGVASNGIVEGIYQSLDKGVTWGAKTVPAETNGLVRAGYNLAFSVDPNHQDYLILGAISWYKSFNGGNTWDYQSNLGHVDQHYFVYVPSKAIPSDSVVMCNDGGIYLARQVATNPTNTLATSKNNSFNVTQFYGGDLHPTANSDYMIAGGQDNGGIILNEPGISGGINYFSGHSGSFGGDHGYCFIDENEPNFQIIASQGNAYYISTDGGDNFAVGLFVNNGIQVNRCDYDDSINKLYAASTPNLLRWNDPQMGNDHDFLTISNASVDWFHAIKVSPNVPNRVYFGSNDGQLYYIDNANDEAQTTYTATSIRTGPISQFYSSIEIEEGNEDHILITYSNYGVNSVWETTNATSGTPTWSSIEGNLPDMPIHWVMLAPDNNDQVLLATETGVWVTENLDGMNTTWLPCTNFPNVRTEMLRYRTSDNRIMAITHGRGIFTTDYFDMSIGTCEHPDFLALVAFYNATDGDNWNTNTGWDISASVGCDPCTWHGIGCDGNGNITSIIMVNNGLTGQLPAEIGDFTHLETLNLALNNLSGSIPEELGNIISLKFSLNLQFNNLTGTIPSTLGNLTNLLGLNLNDNNLEGTLPSELSALPLSNFSVHNNNNLAGCYPESYDVFCDNNTNFSGTGLPDFTAFCEGTLVPNDFCIDALAIPINGTTVGNNTCATNSGFALNPLCHPGGSYQGGDIWFKFTTPTDCGGIFTIDLGVMTSVFSQTHFVVMQGDCNNLTAVDCKFADTSGGGQTSISTLSNLDCNTTYYIQVFDNANDEQGELEVYANCTGDCEIALAVELEDFSGVIQENVNLLKWTTISEKEIAYFEIERSSNDNTNWEKLGTVEIIENEINEGVFEWQDRKPLAKSYYRLRVVENNSKSYFSNVILLERKEVGYFKLSPNPSFSDVKINCFLPNKNGTAFLQIVDFQGKILQQSELPADGVVWVSDKNLVAGVYTCILFIDGNMVQTEKLVLIK